MIAIDSQGQVKEVNRLGEHLFLGVLLKDAKSVNVVSERLPVYGLFTNPDNQHVIDEAAIVEQMFSMSWDETVSLVSGVVQISLHYYG